MYVVTSNVYFGHFRALLLTVVGEKKHKIIFVPHSEKSFKVSVVNLVTFQLRVTGETEN